MDDQNTIKAFMSNIEIGKNHAIAVIKEVLEDGTTNSTVNLSRTKVTPERMESPKRGHIFFTVPGFVSYLKQNETDDTLILADVSDCRICAVLDDKAKDGFEMIYLKPERHPEFILLSQMLDQRMPLPQFAELARRNRRRLGETEDDGREFTITMQQITISSKVTACVGTGKSSTNGVMCTTEVKSGTPRTDIVELPDTVQATVPLYIQRPERTFTIDLTVMANQTEALITADAPELEVLKHQEMTFILDEVSEALAGGIITSVGRISHNPWDYNK